MNRIQRIVLNGELGMLYGNLCGTYYFHNDGQDPVSSRYCFSVPEGACLTGLSVLDESKHMLQGNICASGRIKDQPEASLCQIGPDFYALEWDGLAPGETIAIQISMVVRLCPFMGIARLSIPLGEAENDPSKQVTAPCSVELDFYGKLAETGKSPTHTLEREVLCDGVHLSCKTQSGKDFVLELSMQPQEDRAILEENLGQGLGLYRLVSKNLGLYQREKHSSLLFLLDLSGVHEKSQAGAVKELLFRMVSALPDQTPIQILTTDEEQPRLFPDFVPCTEATCDGLFQALSSVREGCGSVCELLEQEVCKDEDCVVALVSNGMPVDAMEILAKIPVTKPMELFTMGQIKATAFARGWMMGGGRQTHFYSQAYGEDRLSNIMEGLLYRKNRMEIIPLEGNVQALHVLSGTSFATHGYCDVILRYTGRTPQQFALKEEGITKELCIVKEMECYPSVPVIGQIFAENEIQRLLLLMLRTSPESYMRIKEECKDLGITYHVIGPETAIVLQCPQRQVGVVTDFCLGGGGVSKAPVTSIFGEEQGSIPISTTMAKDILRICRRRLTMGCGTDGAMATGLERGYSRSEQTAYGLVALTLLDGKEEVYAMLRNRVKVYLDANPTTGLGAQFPLRREHLLDFLLENKERLLEALPPVATLFEDLNRDYGSVLAAAQMVLYLALTKGKSLNLL